MFYARHHFNPFLLDTQMIFKEIKKNKIHLRYTYWKWPAGVKLICSELKLALLDCCKFWYIVYFKRDWESRHRTTTTLKAHCELKNHSSVGTGKLHWHFPTPRPSFLFKMLFVILDGNSQHHRWDGDTAAWASTWVNPWIFAKICHLFSPGILGHYTLFVHLIFG